MEVNYISCFQSETFPTLMDSSAGNIVGRMNNPDPIIHNNVTNEGLSRNLASGMYIDV